MTNLPDTDPHKLPDEIEQYNKEIDEAMARMDTGEFVTQEDIEAESENWQKFNYPT